MPLAAYLQLVAATNYKQRVRKMTEYYHADRLNYAVAGTPNRLEYDQGFFVKQGDGAADFKPIAHLYKTQVYALAQPSACPRRSAAGRRRPTRIRWRRRRRSSTSRCRTTAWTCASTRYNHGVAAADVAPVVGLQPAQVERVFKDIESKRRTTRYLHLPPVLIEKVVEMLASPPAAAPRGRPARIHCHGRHPRSRSPAARLRRARRARARRQGRARPGQRIA